MSDVILVAGVAEELCFVKLHELVWIDGRITVWQCGCRVLAPKHHEVHGAVDVVGPLVAPPDPGLHRLDAGFETPSSIGLRMPSRLHPTLRDRPASASIRQRHVFWLFGVSGG